MADTPAGQVGELVLVRHGQTEWSRSGQHTSYSDIELTQRGEDEARAAAERLAARHFAAVFTSPMRRARETCRIAGLAEHAVVTDDLCEWNYGDYEGLTTPQIRETNPGWTIFTGDPPGGETAAQVGARADHIIERAVDAAVGGDVALFSHGHFLRVLGARWVGLPPTDGALLRLDTATICVLGHEHGNRVIRVWNA
ncbi:MAG: histidine phosphatase family protein [Acidimicrobiia bacterium]